MTVSRPQDALAGALEQAVGHWEDGGAVSRFDSVDGARAILATLEAAGWRLVPADVDAREYGEQLQKQAEKGILRHTARDLAYVDAVTEPLPPPPAPNGLREALEHTDHNPGLHIDPDGVVRCFARTHGGADPVVFDIRAALTAAPPPALEVHDPEIGVETLAHMLDHHYDQGHTTDEDGVAEDFIGCAEEMLNWLEAASEDAAYAAPAPPLDGAEVVRLLHSVGNTLAGWVRHMEGYGDDALARAIDFVIQYPDPQERIAVARRAAGDGEGKA